MTAELATLLALTAIGMIGVGLVVAPAPATRRRHPKAPRSPWPLATAVGCGTVVFAASGWLLPAVALGASAGWASRSVVTARRTRRTTPDVSDALASWVENLRDVLLAGEQPIGAIRATVRTCPDPIRPAVNRLAIGLGRRDPPTVLRNFADDVDDPLGDLVAVGLIIAIERGGRTVDVLSSLAAQARTQADRRRLVEAERAPVRREVTLLTVIMAALVVGLLVFGRAEYLAPYDEPAGQVFVTVVLVLYGGLLLRVRLLARYPTPRRFFSTATREPEGSPRTIETSDEVIT